MFVIAKAHLVDVLRNDVGIEVVKETVGSYAASEEARVFSIPRRGLLAQNFDHRNEIVERYEDPADLNTFGEPKIKHRIQKGIFSQGFLVELTHRTAVLLNDNFKNFVRNVGKFIYDGQTATRIDVKGDTIFDNRGNLIKITFGSVAWNDNNFYKEVKHWVGMEITFEGGIFLVPDPEAADIVLPDPKIEIGTVAIP